MPGFEEALVGRVLGQAAKPVLDGVRHSLARRGYGRADVHTSLGRLSLRPATLSLVGQLPVGVTQRDVTAALDSPEGAQVLRRVIALHLEAHSRDEPVDMREAVPKRIGEKIKASLVALISTQVQARHRGPERQQVRLDDVRSDQLDHYAARLYDLLVERGGAWAGALVGSLREPEQSLEWAFRTLVRHQLTEIEHYLEVLAKAVAPGAEVFEEWQRAYRVAFEAQHSTIQLPQFERRLVPYEALFVPGEFRPWGTTARNLVPEGRVSFEDFAVRTGKTVILGDPGAGKSTTSTLLARQAFDRGQVPFVIRLKNVDVDRDGFNLEETVEAVLRTRYQCPAPVGAIRRLLTEGRAFLVFDGLDELVDTTARETAAQTIDAVAALHPFTRVLVTSRRVGYSVARLDTELFDEFLIGSFGHDQVREYARRWFTLVREAEDPPVDSTVRGFLEAGRAIADLRANPLMLAFICILYQGRGTIPHKRPEIFRQCVELFLHRWDGKRGIGGPPANLDLVELALSYVAHAVLTDRRYRDGVTEDQVFDLVVDSLLEEGVPDRRGAKRVVRELLDLCRGRAWIFTDVGDDRHGDEVFHFTHASFLEYFAALHVNRTTDSPEKVAELLAPEIAAGRWEVLGQVCISLRLRSARAGAARVMDAILGRAESVMVRRRNTSSTPRSSPHDEDVALAEFLLRASETLPVSSETLRRLIELSADHFTMGRSNGLSALLNTDYQYVDAAYGKLGDLLSSSIRSYALGPNKYTKARAWFAAHFGYLADQPLAHHVDLRRLNDTRTRLVTPDVLDLLAAQRSTFAWNVRLHIGGDLDTTDLLSFVRLFEGCHGPLREFGPRSTVEWIVNCLSSPARAGLPTSTAVRLLRQVTHAASTDNDLPIGGEAHLLIPSVLEAASARVVGYDDDVLAGWCAVVMGVHELWEIATATPREQLLVNGNLNRVFTHAIARGVRGDSRISRWRAGVISTWKHPSTSVS